MGMLIPLGDERHDLRLHVLFPSKVGHPKTLPLEDAEPLLYVIHPRAMSRCELEKDPCLAPIRDPDTNLLIYHCEKPMPNIKDIDQLRSERSTIIALRGSDPNLNPCRSCLGCLTIRSRRLRDAAGVPLAMHHYRRVGF